MNATDADNLEYLSWIQKKHRFQSPDFVRKLVKNCADEFAAKSVSSTEQRVEIYKQVREALQHTFDTRLRRHAKVCCCS
jgi:hypothetical protein